MKEFDVTDEAVIAATPEEVVGALRDEASGRSCWWYPFATVTRTSPTDPQVGAEVELLASASGRVDGGRDVIRVHERVVGLSPDGIDLVVDGDFAGHNAWRFRPAGAAGTRVSFRWVARPRGLRMRVLARLVDIPAMHSRILRAAFARIEHYVAEQRARGPGRVS